MVRFDLKSIRLSEIKGEAVTLGDLLRQQSFSHMDLIRAIMEPLASSEIATYLSAWDEDDVHQKINLKYLGFPPLFYASHINDCKLVRLLIEMGASLDISGKHSVPLLAWTILEDHPESFQLVATLLSLGCSPTIIPSDMYEDIMKPSGIQQPKRTFLRRNGVLQA